MDRMHFVIVIAIAFILRSTECDLISRLPTQLLNNESFPLVVVLTKARDSYSGLSNAQRRSKLVKTSHAELNETEIIKRQEVQRQHNERMNEIINFMKDRQVSTKYFHTEMKRIIETNKVMNDLREMVAFLEMPGHEKVKKVIMTVFNKVKGSKLAKSPSSIWRFPTHNLVVNVIRDPANYGNPN